MVPQRVIDYWRKKGVSKTVIEKRVAAFSGAASAPRPKKVRWVDRLDELRDIAGDHTIAELADYFGCSKNAVRKQCMVHNIEYKKVKK